MRRVNGMGRDRMGGAVRLDKPIWKDRTEVPVLTLTYPEGRMEFFATGTVRIRFIVVDLTVRFSVICGPKGIRWGLSAEKRKECSMALRKVTQQAAGKPAAGPGITDAGDFPTLVEYLTQATYPDGSKREVASLIIVADAGGWRGCLNDKDNQRSMWKAADSVLGLLMALEQAAAEDDPTAWRQQAAAAGKRKK